MSLNMIIIIICVIEWDTNDDGWHFLMVSYVLNIDSQYLMQIISFNLYQKPCLYISIFTVDKIDNEMIVK